MRVESAEHNVPLACRTRSRIFAVVTIPIESAAERVPATSMMRTWLLTFGIIVVLLGGWECYWRMRGWTPTVEGNEEAWILARGRLEPTSTVLTGSSRIQASFQPEVWVEAMGGEWPIQLALNGGSPLPVLEDLAAEPTFRGTVIAELLPYYTFNASLAGEVRAREFLRSHRSMEESPAKRWEAYLRTRVAGRLVFRRGGLLPHHIVNSYRSGDLKMPPVYGQRPDRFQPITMRPDPTGRTRAGTMDSSRFSFVRRNSTPLQGAGFDSVMARLARSVRQIQARGGEVYLLHLHSCGGRRQIEYDMFPKAAYIERIAEIPSVKLLDSDTDAELAALPCRDGSHVSRDEAPIVTRRIARFVADTRAAAKP